MPHLRICEGPSGELIDSTPSFKGFISTKQLSVNRGSSKQAENSGEVLHGKLTGEIPSKGGAAGGPSGEGFFL